MVDAWGVVLWGPKHGPGICYYAKAAFHGQCALEASTHSAVCWSHGNGAEIVFILQRGMVVPGYNGTDKRLMDMVGPHNSVV